MEVIISGLLLFAMLGICFSGDPENSLWDIDELAKGNRDA